MTIAVTIKRNGFTENLGCSSLQQAIRIIKSRHLDLSKDYYDITTGWNSSEFGDIASWDGVNGYWYYKLQDAAGREKRDILHKKGALNAQLGLQAKTLAANGYIIKALRNAL